MGLTVVQDRYRATPFVGETGLYAVSVNADLASAAWSVAVVSAQMFAGRFEDPIVP